MSTDDASIQKVPSLFTQLAESVGTMAHLPNNGAAYHTGEQVITHLNRVLGPDGWSFHILDQGQEEDSDEWWVFAQITAIIDGQAVVKQDYGSQAMKRARSTGKFISKGEDRKAAATDALKRCARLLGVGLDAWANEKAPSWRPEQDDDGRLPKNVTGAPTQEETTQERWQRLVSEAEHVQLDTLGRVKAIDPKAATEPQLRSYADLLEQRLKGVRAA